MESCTRSFERLVHKRTPIRKLLLSYIKGFSPAVSRLKPKVNTRFAHISPWSVFNASLFVILADPNQIPKSSSHNSLRSCSTYLTFVCLFTYRSSILLSVSLTNWRTNWLPLFSPWSVVCLSTSLSIWLSTSLAVQSLDCLFISLFSRLPFPWTSFLSV